ncbi:MAG: hypothetical protein Q9182_006463 [Xanthomendoza sp. 2 TL-2023]
MSVFQFETIAGKPCTLSSTSVEKVESNMRERCKASKALTDHMLSPESRYQALMYNTCQRRGRYEEVMVPIFRDEKTPGRFPFPSDSIRLPSHSDISNNPRNHLMMGINPAVAVAHACSLQITMQLCDIVEARKLYDQLIPLGPIMLALTAATTIWDGVLANTDVRWNGFCQVPDDRTLNEKSDKPSRDGSDKILRPRVSSNGVYISEDPRLVDKHQDPNLLINEQVKQQLLDGGMDDRLATHFAHLFIRDPLIIFAEDMEPEAPDDTAFFETLQSSNWNTVRFKPPPSITSKDTGWRVEFRPMEVQMTDFENAAFATFIVLLSRTILHFDLNLYMPIAMVDENMEKAHVRDAVNCEHFYFRTDPLSGSMFSSPATETHANSLVGSQASSASRPPKSSASTGPSTEDDAGSSSNGETDSSGTSVNITLDDISSPTKQPQQASMSMTALPDPASTTNTCLESPRPFGPPLPQSPSFLPTKETTDSSSYCSLFPISTLMNGHPSSPFPGFIPLIRDYLCSPASPSYTPSARAKIDGYLALIAARASGEAWTAARWQREFVRKHKEYNGDSIVGDKVMYDLLCAVRGMEWEDGRMREAGEMFRV